MLPESYIGLGEGTKLIDASFLSCEGTQQGTVDGPPVFTIALNEINNISHRSLTAHGGALFSIIDDTTLICTLDVALRVFESHEQQLHAIGLSINRDKCKNISTSSSSYPRKSFEMHRPWYMYRHPSCF